MEVAVWFVVVFVIMWVAGPLGQVLFLIAPKLHHRLGMTEANALKPEFRWFLLDERAIAYADLTYLVSGIAFIWLAVLGNRTALIFGLYTCACYVYIAALTIPRWLLLTRDGLNPAPREQLAVYIAYMVLYCSFGLYGLFYLWGLAQP